MKPLSEAAPDLLDIQIQIQAVCFARIQPKLILLIFFSITVHVN